MGGALFRTAVLFLTISLLTIALLSIPSVARGQGAVLIVPTMFSTIQAAVNSSVPGDTVLVLPGTYYENVYLPGKSEITVKGTDPLTTIVDGRRAGNVFYVYGGFDVTIEGFTIRNSGLAGSLPGNAGVHINFGSLVHVRRNIITGNGIGISLWNELDADCYVEGNLIVRNNESGVSNDGCSRPQIIGNTMVENGFAGYRSWVGSGPVTIRDNIVAANQGIGIGLHRDDAGRAIDHNDVYANQGGDYCEGYYTPCDNSFAPGPGSISADPVFVSSVATDYRLRTTSPCVDAGTNASFLVLDLAGSPRPIDGNRDGIATVDMGAYEAQVPPPFQLVAVGTQAGVPAYVALYNSAAAAARTTRVRLVWRRRIAYNSL